jgi:aspartate aminotransferase-like enzyme
MAGQVLRIGLMGFGSTALNVMAVLYALEAELLKLGHKLDVGAGVAEASRSLNAP